MPRIFEYNIEQHVPYPVAGLGLCRRAATAAIVEMVGSSSRDSMSVCGYPASVAAVVV